MSASAAATAVGPPEVEGVTHRWVEARGLRFHVAEAGAGNDVVLCLHGWPQHWYEWREVLPALADRHRVLALDLRGCGWSDAPRDGYEKENLATDVLAVLDALELDRVGLISHDWGGWIGFLLCLRAPARFEGFMPLNIVPPWVSKRAIFSHLWRFTYQGIVLTPGLGFRLHVGGDFVKRVLVSGSTVREVWTPEVLDAFAASYSEPERARAAVQIYRVFNTRETPAIARGRYAKARLEVSTRMVFGEDDPVLRPDMLAGYQRYASEMAVEIVADTGHFIVDERPELVIARAREFFAGGA